MGATRNILAAILMFLIFLMIPGYLDLIGLGPDNSNETSQTINSETKKGEPVVYPSEIHDTNKYNQISSKHIRIITDLFDATISNRGGGSFLEYKLIANNDDGLKYIGSYNENGDYNNNDPVLLNYDLLDMGCSPCLSFDNQEILINHPFNLVTSLNNDTLRISGDETLEIDYIYKNDLGDFVEKQMIFYGNSYNINSSFNFNLSNTHPNKNVEISWLSGIMPAELMEVDELSYSSAYIGLNGDLESITQSSIEGVDLQVYNETKTDWFALRNKFFTVSIMPEEASDFSILSSNNVALGNRAITPIYNASLGYKMNNGTLSFKTFLGPLDTEHINKFDSELQLIMNFGWAIIKPFSKFILWFLRLLHNSIGINYGVVLIILAFIMRIVTGPLTKKSYESSVKMKVVAPLQKKIQEKYKDDPKKLQQEMGKLWKKHGFNPAMSCIAPLLQMPLLMSFFIVFRSTVEFRGQPFMLWITDLSQPDYIFSLPFSLPLYGSAVAVLPILMGISMFLTMRISMQSAEDSQKYMMYFMNGFFILIFNTFPSGLTLYYTVYNFLSFQQQLSIKKNS